MFPANITRDEAMSRSGLLQTDAYRVLIDLTGRENDVTDPQSHFLTTSTIAFQGLADGNTHVDVIADRLLTATLDGKPLDTSSFNGYRLDLPVTAGHHELSITAVHRFSRSGEGLHRFVDPADERIYLYTQHEAADARRTFACFDQPNLKATFEFTVLAPIDWTVISNAAAVDPEDIGDGFGRWSFTPTLRLSTYLTAVVAGHYHRVTDSYTGAAGREVPLSVMCRQSMVEYLDSDRILSTTKSGFDVFEKHFGMPYPFGTYDQAYVPEFNFGAMENAGCVTHRDEYLFRSRQTAAAYEGRDNTILHELAHMWFGDLVTMTWWDDLWLNESFAEWASHFAQSEYVDPESPWVTFGNARKTWAYRQDQLPSTHPIAADMVDMEAVEQNFDGITYAKGASALRQLVAYVGKEEFLAGVRDYFAEHAFGNTQFNDLLSALEKSSGRDLSEWAAQWLQTCGVSTLRAEFTTDDEGRFTSFGIRQTVPAQYPTFRDHRIAIGLWRAEGDTMVRERIECDVHGEFTPIEALVGTQQPDLVLINDDDLTYAKVRLDPRSMSTLVERLKDIPSPLSRAVCWSSAWDMCRDGEFPVRHYVALVLAGVATESDLSAVQRTLGQAWTAIVHFSGADERPGLISAFERGLARLLKSAEPGSDHQVVFVRQLAAVVASAAGGELLQAWYNGEEVPEGLSVDTDLRWVLVRHLARLGRVDNSVIDAELSRDDTIGGRQFAAAARAALPTAEAKAEAWRIATTVDIPNETHRQLVGAFNQPGQEDVLADYVDKYIAVVNDIAADREPWPQRGQSISASVLTGLFPSLMATPETLQKLDDWFAGADFPARVRRSLMESLDDLRRSLHCQQQNTRLGQDVTSLEQDDTTEIPPVEG